MSCSWESEEFKYDCSGETSRVPDTGQFITALLLLLLIVVLLALCKRCESEKEKLDRRGDDADKIDTATADSTDIELGNVKSSAKEEHTARSHFDSTYI